MPLKKRRLFTPRRGKNVPHKILGLIPFALILLIILGISLSGITHEMNFQTLKEQHLKYKEYAHSHPVTSSFYFLSIYILSVVLVIPDAILLTLIGGLLFPLPLAIFYACLGETLGGALFFGAAKLALKNSSRLQKSKLLHTIEHKIENEEVYYLLFFRFSHLLPFWLINFLSALLEVRFWTFVWTLFVGILPMAILFSDAGSGFSQYLDTHEHLHLYDILNPKIKMALIGISLIPLIPILIKKWRRRKNR